MTQNQKVLDLLRQAGSRGITPLDGFELAHSWRLAARIHELRELGYTIETTVERTPGGAKVARYRLYETTQLTLVAS